MTLLQLEAFCSVVERGSFAAASKQLGVQPSAVSRRVASLEEDLGVVLLLRTTRSVNLSEAGRDFFERARDALNALHDAEADLLVADGALSGTIRVAVPGAIGRRLLARPLFAFMKRHPGVSLDLRISDSRLDLVAEGIDVAVRAGRASSPNFAQRVLCRSSQVFCASRGYLATRGTPEALADLVHHQRVVRRQGEQLLDLTTPGLPPPVMICDDVETVAEAVRAGLGLGLLPLWLARELPELVQLALLLPIESGEITAILPGGRRPSRRVRALLDHLAEALSVRLKG